MVPMVGIEPTSRRYQHRANPLSYTGVKLKPLTGKLDK